MRFSVHRRTIGLAVALLAPLLTVPLGASPAHASACTRPVWTTSQPDAMRGFGRLIVHNNMWNASSYRVSQRLRACGPRNWTVDVNANNRSGDGAVKTYPNVHRDWHNWSTGREPRLRSFKLIRSHFAARTPRRGIYNAAYDIWLNGVPNDEVMIWTDNRRQVPGGRRVARGLHFGNRTWSLFASRDNGYLAFVPNRRLTRGTIYIKAMLGWLVRHHRVSRNATLGQIGFGFEVVSTGGRPARFKVERFSIRTARR